MTTAEQKDKRFTARVSCKPSLGVSESKRHYLGEGTSESVRELLDFSRSLIFGAMRVGAMTEWTHFKIEINAESDKVTGVTADATNPVKTGAR